MTDLNLAGESYAHSLIAAGRVDRTSTWSFSAEDGNALLGKSGDDWESYSKAHLGLDRSANEKTKARYRYPFAKGGKIYRSGIIAVKQRAAQQGDGAIEKAAAALLVSVDKSEGKSRSSTVISGQKFSPFEYKFVADGPEGTFEGYGSVFGNEDDGGDLVKPGAFDQTLAQHAAAKTMPKMLLHHGGLAFGTPTPEDLIPIGKWNAMSPDSHGLQTKGRLINLDTESGKRIYGAMKENELSGLSMGYKATDFTRGTNPNEPRRTIRSANLFEVSPVTFPMNPLATIHSVKSAIFDITSLERLLRDAGLSRTEAKALLAEGYKGLPLRDAEGDEEVVAMLNRATALFSLASWQR